MSDPLLVAELEYWRNAALEWSNRYAVARATAFDEAAALVARHMAGWEGDAADSDVRALQAVWEGLIKMRGRVFGG